MQAMFAEKPLADDAPGAPLSVVAPSNDYVLCTVTWLGWVRSVARPGGG